MYCFECVWLSNGFNGDKGSNYCYANEEYVEPDGACPFWQATLRDEPLQGPQTQIQDDEEG